MTNKTFFIESAFGKIPAIVYEPTAPNGNCIIFFHGRGETGNGELTGPEGLPKLLNSSNHSNLLKNALPLGFTVLAPQLVPKLTNWNIWWTPKYIDECIDYAVAALTRHPKVVITGLSQGGGAVWSACTSSDNASRIFAAIGICPTPQYEGDFSLIAKNNTPIMNFHAVNDTTVGVQSSRNMVNKANEFNPNPKVIYEEFSTGSHYIWGSVYDRPDVYDFILKYSSKQEPAPEPIPIPTDKVLYRIQTTVYESGKIESIKI